MAQEEAIATDDPSVTVRLTSEKYHVIDGDPLMIPVYRITCPRNVNGYGPAARALGLRMIGKNAGVHHWNVIAAVLIYDGFPLAEGGELVEDPSNPATAP